MAASPTFTFDIEPSDGGARRPTLEDLGGAVLINHATHPPPNDGSMLHKDMGNQWQHQLAGLARMIPTARISIEFSLGSPFVSELQTASATLTPDDFLTVDNGDGDVTIAWDDGLLPPMTCQPTGNTNNGSGDTSFDAVKETANSVRVRVKLAGVASNVPFTVAIH